MNSTIYEYLTNPTSTMRWVNMSIFGKDPHSTDKVENLIEDWRSKRFYIEGEVAAAAMVVASAKNEETWADNRALYSQQPFSNTTIWHMSFKTSLKDVVARNYHFLSDSTYLFYENTLKTDLTWGSTNEYWVSWGAEVNLFISNQSLWS